MANKCLGVFLVILVFPLVVLSIITLGTKNLTDALYYKDILNNTNSYPKIADLIHTINPKDDLSRTFIKNINPSWLKENIETNLIVLDSYLHNKTDEPNFLITLSPFKNDLQKQIPSGVNVTIPEKLAFNDYKTLLENLQKNVPTAAASFQSEPQSSSTFKMNSIDNFSSLRRDYNYYKFSTYILFGITILILAIIIFLARSYPPAIFRWLGQALFWPSLMVMSATLIIRKVATYWSIMDKIEMSNEIRALVTPIYNFTLQSLLSRILIISIIIMSFGLILTISSYIYGHFYKPIVKNA